MNSSVADSGVVTDGVSPLIYVHVVVRFSPLVELSLLTPFVSSNNFLLH